MGADVHLVRSAERVEAIGELYVQRLVPDARETVAALRWLGKDVRVISGGLRPPVEEREHTRRPEPRPEELHPILRHRIEERMADVPHHQRSEEVGQGRPQEREAEQRLHLLADMAYQLGMVRFLENHDEPRAAATFVWVQLHRQVRFEGAVEKISDFFDGIVVFGAGLFPEVEQRTAHVRAHRLRARDPVIARGALHRFEPLVDQHHHRVRVIRVDRRALLVVVRVRRAVRVRVHGVDERQPGPGRARRHRACPGGTRSVPASHGRGKPAIGWACTGATAVARGTRDHHPAVRAHPWRAHRTRRRARNRGARDDEPGRAGPQREVFLHADGDSAQPVVHPGQDARHVRPFTASSGLFALHENTPGIASRRPEGRAPFTQVPCPERNRWTVSTARVPGHCSMGSGRRGCWWWGT